MKKLRRFLVIGVMVLSVLAMSGIAIAPVKAAASAGDLIKMAGNSAVYYLGNDGKRYVFPNPATYNSWYSDFSGVVTIPSSELQSYPLGGNVSVRPGTTLVKITTDPSVYAVEPNGVLVKIQSEAQAASLYGSNWNKRIVDVPDYLFTNYTIGQPLPAGQFPIGSLVKNANSATIYYYDGTNFRQIASEAAFTANRFQFSNVLSTTSTITAGGNQVTNAEFVNVSQNATTGGGTVITGSGLMVSLNAATPVAATVPSGAVNVPYTKVNFTAASDGPVTLNTVTFTRSGVGSANDFVNVYLYDGATRLTTGRTVNSSSNKVNFTGLNYTIPAGTTKTLTLTADINTGNNDSFGIASASDITSTGANVSGSFPVNGNIMNIVTQTTGHITITKSGSWANPKAGQTDVKVGEFQLQTSSVEDVMVKGLTLYQSGSINNSYLTNFVLTQSGNTIATASGVNANSQIVFNFNAPYLMTKGSSNTFELFADINGSARSGDTINLYVDNNADLFAVGQTYGYGVAVSRASSDTPAGSYDGTAGSSLSTIQVSQLTFSFQGPASTDYATQQKAVVLASYNVTAQNNLEIRKTYLSLTDTNGYLASNGTSNFTNVRLINHATGAQLAGGSDVPVATSTTYAFTFTDVWDMTSGQTMQIDVVADVANYTPASSETITATLGKDSTHLFGDTDVKNLDNNTFIADSSIVPSTAIVGNPMNIKSSSASINTAGTPTANTVINGAQNVPMTGVNIAAGTGKDVKISSIKFTAASTVSACSSNVSNCVLDIKLYDGTTQIGSTQSLSNNVATFNNLNYTITKGTTKTLTAYADLNTLSGTPSGYVTLGVAASTDVTAQDINGNNVNMTGTAPGMQQSITGAGTLATSKSADIVGSTDSRLVVAGTVDQPIASFHFSAQNESLKMQKVRILIAGLTATSTAGATATVANAASYITNVSLWDGATQVANDVTPSWDGTNAIADFSSTISDFIVPSNGSNDLTVKVSYNGNFNSSLLSGVKLTASLDGTTANFKFIGANSSTVITKANVSGTSNINGNPIYLFKSIPTVTNAMANSVLTAGNQTLAKYTVAADAKGAVDWKKMAFTISSSNIGNIDTPTLVDENNNVVATLATGTVSTSTSFTLTFTSNTDNQIAAGSSKTYSLKANVTLASSNTNSASISTVFNRTATEAYAPATISGINGVTSNFNWSDESGAPHVDGTSADYFGDFLVKNLPTDSQTLSK